MMRWNIAVSARRVIAVLFDRGTFFRLDDIYNNNGENNAADVIITRGCHNVRL